MPKLMTSLDKDRSLLALHVVRQQEDYLGLFSIPPSYGGSVLAATMVQFLTATDTPRLSERDQRLERARRAALLQHEAINEANSLAARSSRPDRH